MSDLQLNRKILSLLNKVLTAGANVTLTADNETIEIASSGGGGGSTDHGTLTGLVDDDHTHYYNSARLNAWAGSSAITTIGTLIAGSIPVSLITGLGTLATQSGTFSGTSSGTNTGDQTITLTGDVTGSGTSSFSATVANDAITYAKIQNVSSASKLLGRGDSGGGDVEEITLGSGLTMTGTTLSASGGGGGSSTFSQAEINIGSSPRLSGSFSITGLTGLTVGKPVNIFQDVGGYTGKGTREDEAEMDGLIVTGVVDSTSSIKCYWNSTGYVKGNFKFRYLVGA